MIQRLEKAMAARAEEADLLDRVTVRTQCERLAGVVVGNLSRVAADGAIYVEFPGNPVDGPIRAQSLVALGPEQVGERIGLQFELGDLHHPIITGFLRDRAEPRRTPSRPNPARILLEADQEIEIRCGESSIVMKADGTVRIRGRDLLSRSSGSNRIKGGAVQIN